VSPWGRMAAKMLASRVACGTALLLLAVALLGVVPSAFAHTVTASVPTMSDVAAPPQTVAPSLTPRLEVLAAAPVPFVPVWLAVAALVLTALLVRAPRRVAGAVFAIVLGVVAFETGVHAVHHLGDTHAASHCVVASVAPHLGGTTDAPATNMPCLAMAPHAVVVTDVVVLPARPFGPSAVRAPPAPAS
jgi:hypothetical protein